MTTQQQKDCENFAILRIDKRITIVAVLLLLLQFGSWWAWFTRLDLKVDQVCDWKKSNESAFFDIRANARWIKENDTTIRNLPRLEERLKMMDDQLSKMQLLLHEIDRKVSRSGEKGRDHGL